MPNPRPRSKKRGSGASFARSPSAPSQRRARGESPRSLLIGALVVACLALLIDTLACLFTVSEYGKCGHLHVDIMLTVTGIALSALAVVAFRW